MDIVIVIVVSITHVQSNMLSNVCGCNIKGHKLFPAFDGSIVTNVRMVCFISSSGNPVFCYAKIWPLLVLYMRYVI